MQGDQDERLSKRQVFNKTQVPNQEPKYKNLLIDVNSNSERYPELDSPTSTTAETSKLV